ncbi:MAG: ergothioneine biosynthesis protein EgtB [Polyangiales bacterium]
MRPLAERFRRIRTTTESICAPLAIEDHVVQTFPDASPAKWHLGHTAWFFETFVLAKQADFKPFHPRFGFVFNSYYEAVGDRVARPRRGTLSRPTVAEVHAYRRSVDERMLALLSTTEAHDAVVELGLHHEQQHQELLYTDLKTVFAENPLRPAYRPRPAIDRGAERRGDGSPAIEQSFVSFEGGVRSIGHEGSEFSFDNERPRHHVFVESFALARRPVSNREWIAFIDDGGYRRPELWLSDGWGAVQAHAWRAPLHWGDGEYATLAGWEPIDLDAPVSHVSLYEADAFARWAGARLPTEAEWEIATENKPIEGNFAESGALQPMPTRSLFGDVWQWTSSAYAPYPGFRPLAGALGEYNGKFMCNQLVLRGGSCATPRDHLRTTYRNFFPPDARWQFTGLRLAKDA